VLEAAEQELAAYRDETIITAIGKDAYVSGLHKRQDAVDGARRVLGEANASSPLAEIRDLRETWPTLDQRERRHLLAAVLDHAVVTPAPRAGRGAPVDERMQLVWR
jgi:hypothetical protein